MQNDKIKEYWEGEAGIYSEGIKAELKSETAENWKNLILEYAPEKEHLEVLDVGCGPGFFEIMLGKEGHHVTGIDITENMIHEAKENVKAAGLSADLMTMDCHNLNFPDETFDMIICRNITWTLDDPQKAYKEWLRVLKKGGCILNYDGNYYLHYYDEEYRQEYEIRQIHHGDEHKYIENVDVNIINNVARDLPLSREKRPQWDINLLLEMGVKGLETEVDRSRFEDEHGKDHQVIDHFMIYAVK